jgi:hypothetical protein
MTDADILILIVGLSFVALLITGLVGRGRKYKNR